MHEPPTPRGRKRANGPNKMTKTKKPQEHPYEFQTTQGEDDEDFYKHFQESSQEPPPKRPRGRQPGFKLVKKEEVKAVEDQPAYQFKMENDGVIDLENDEYVGSCSSTKAVW